MPETVQTKIVATLAVATVAMLALVLATPFVFFDERPGLPVYPALTIDYVEEDGVFIVLLSSVSGDHLFTDIGLEINGVTETMNYSYAIERHVASDRIEVMVTLMDENDNHYELNATIEKVAGTDPIEFELLIEDADNAVADTLTIEDFPFTRRLAKVVE